MAGDLLVIGRVTKPHGIRGEVRVKPFTESVGTICGLVQVYIRRSGREEKMIRIVEARTHKNVVLLKFEGIIDRQGAEDLAGAEILARREWLPDLEEDEYYWADLIGLDVFDEQDRNLGKAVYIISAGADDIVVLEKNGREILIPFREEIILEVDLEGGRLLVSPPEGLLDLD